MYFEIVPAAYDVSFSYYVIYTPYAGLSTGGAATVLLKVSSTFVNVFWSLHVGSQLDRDGARGEDAGKRAARGEGRDGGLTPSD